MDIFKENLLYATSTKADGNMSFRLGEESEVSLNREHFFAKNKINSAQCAEALLEHGDTIAVVTDTKKRAVVADALITNIPEIFLFLITADCFPVAYFDPVQKVVALAHLGWKSSGLNLAGKVVERMQNEFASQAKDIFVSFGPGIHKESYLVEAPMQKENPRWQNFLEEKEEHTSVDLIGFNKNVLKEVAVLKENISVSPVDTAVSDDYFSHYRSVRTGEPEGRFVTILGLK